MCGLIPCTPSQDKSIPDNGLIIITVSWWYCGLGEARYYRIYFEKIILNTVLNTVSVSSNALFLLDNIVM